MKFNLLKSLTILAISMSVSACAQTKRMESIGDGTSYASLVEATSQRTLPGIQGAGPSTDIHIIIVWNKTQPPESFFWRGMDGWAGCNVMKALKRKKQHHGEDKYTLQEVKLYKIKKGDVLQLTPVSGGKYHIPDEIPKSATNTVYFKTVKTSWLSLPVKNITQEKDLIMP